VATSFRIELDSRGMRALVGSDWAQGVVQAKADEVAAAANGRGVKVDGEPGDQPVPIAVIPARGRRARAQVWIDHPSGVAVESKHRLLVGALG
jgi:hypothetical protein